MSSRGVQWTGMTELKAFLRELPADLTDAAATVVADAAQEAYDEAFANYPTVTGNLKRGLVVNAKGASGNFVASAILRNRAPHAYLYEVGTVARNYLGANRGVMPAGHVFYPAVGRASRRMYGRLAGLLRMRGFEVTGGRAA